MCILKFIADDMVGKLARLMRILGYDTAFEIDISNNRLITMALNEKRIILTRDTRLIKRTLVKDYLLIESDSSEQQLEQVLSHYKLNPSRTKLLTRCLDCNYKLKEISKNEVKGKVWPYVYDQHDNFRTCLSCGKIYWPGDHVAAMLTRLTDWKINLSD